MVNRVTIYEGDCLVVLRTLPSAERGHGAHRLVPYGTTYAPWDSPIALEALWSEWLRVTKPNAAIVLTASQPFTSSLVMSRPKLLRMRVGLGQSERRQLRQREQAAHEDA